MGLAALLACALMAGSLQESSPDPAPAAEPLGGPVTIPSALSSRPGGETAAPGPAAPEPSAAPVLLTIPPGPRASRPLEEREESGPGVAGFLVGAVAVFAVLGGGLLLLRRFGRNSRLLGTGGAIKVLARKAVGQKQEILLIEVGPKVFMVGSTRDHLSRLGEFASPDEVAVLRSHLPERREDAPGVQFSQSLREGIRQEEAPREDHVFASIADELAEIRKTVRAWRA